MKKYNLNYLLSKQPEKDDFISIVIFLLRFCFGLFASMIWIFILLVPFWILGSKNVVYKWNKFMDSMVFNE